MGLHGKIPMTDEERAARGARDRRKTGHITSQAIAAWASRAERFEELGQSLVETATGAPQVQTRANGPQMDPRFRAGMELLDAADKLWARVHRARAASPTPRTPPTNGNGSADDIDDYINAKPRN